jgi:hypothetical protein
LARAPRRTVQAVAAAVAGVFANNLPSARATPPTVVRSQPADIPGREGGIEVGLSAEELTETLRSARRERRICKKKRRMATKAAKVASVSSLAADVDMSLREAKGIRMASGAVEGKGGFENESPSRVSAISDAPSMTKRRKQCDDIPGGLSGGVALDDGADKPLEMEVQLEEVLDDYFADAPMVVKEAGPSVVEGAQRKALLKNYERHKKFLTAVCANAALGRGSFEAKRTRGLIEGLEAQLGIGPNLTGIRRRDG